MLDIGSGRATVDPVQLPAEPRAAVLHGGDAAAAGASRPDGRRPAGERVRARTNV